MSALGSEYDLDHGVIRTVVQPSAARALTAAFLLLIFGVPMGQIAWELSRSRAPDVLDVFHQVPTRASLRQFEDNLERNSLPRSAIRPWLQLGLSDVMGFGSDKVVIGRDGWLFYGPGVDYLTGPGFLNSEQLHHRHKKMVEDGNTEFQPDPRPAILEFHRQCQERGVRLVLLPIPDKAQIHPGQLSRYAAFDTAMQPPNNPDYPRFLAELREQGVEIIDLHPPRLDPNAQFFLVQDTHWTPQWMDQAAQQVAEDIRPRLSPAAALPLTKQVEDVARHGDLVDMLRLPDSQTQFKPQTVMVERIVDATSKLPWQPSPGADVLVLGDSFSNIYSSDQMGWGDSAGFVEHLAYHLGRSVDRLVRNDAGAHATREMLATELRRGNDRLAGKKIIIWEFAARELACGDWKRLPLVLGEKKPVQFYTPASDQAVEIRGVVRAVSPAPRPGTVPYKDHILMIHLGEIDSVEDTSAVGKEAVVFAWSMRDNQAMPAARYRPGETIRLRVRPWNDVAAKYETINRSGLSDDDLLLVDPAWAADAGQKN